MFEAHLDKLWSEYSEERRFFSFERFFKRSFASKIDLIDENRILSKWEVDDLKIFKDIRNKFAHNLFGCDFESPEISLLCKRFSIIDQPEDQWLKNTKGRERFYYSVIIFHAMFSWRHEAVKTGKEYANPIFDEVGVCVFKFP